MILNSYWLLATDFKWLLLTGNLHYIVTAYWQLTLECYVLLAFDFEFLQFMATNFDLWHFTGNWH